MRNILIGYMHRNLKIVNKNPLEINCFLINYDILSSSVKQYKITWM